MRIYAVYILLEDGTCIFSLKFYEMPDSALITAMLSAMMSFINEVSGSNAKKLSTGGFVFHIEKVGRMSVVVATDSDEAPPELPQLRTRFISKYGQYVTNFKGITDMFYPFEDDVMEILKLDSLEKRVEPSKQLNSYALLQIPKNLQKIARKMVRVKESNVNKLANELELPKMLTQIKLDRLYNEGYVGRYFDGDQFIYFL